MQFVVCAASAVFGSVLTFAYGMWPESLTFLLVVIAIDYITGVTAAVREKQGLSSVVGAWGLAKKGIILLVVLLAHRIDILLKLETVAMGAAIYFYIANELISITENLGRIGVPLPDRLRQIIEILKDKGKS
ncbi:phage holin family protein [Paenibacillus oenotherae]|uniref:Phage holin family protein n=1 Tax=Paenibacillus oenotherae TaxID=1435645 RepID=A0ABS7D8D8_9BACL|nr:phage holin family protein [Paenibacillus oenotherae]MBW7476146.1 phage holin family protein [Paenibacillus oenotherae]